MKTLFSKGKLTIRQNTEPWVWDNTTRVSKKRPVWHYRTGIYCTPEEFQARISFQPPWQREIDLNNKEIKRLRKQNSEYKFKLEQWKRREGL